MSKYSSKIIKILCLLIFLKGCAYFNTFYNAEQHFDNAESARIRNLGAELPLVAIQEYGMAIKKSEKILKEFSDSKYVQDAMLLKGKSHYFRREYNSSTLIFNQLLLEEEFEAEARYWLALCKWKDFRPQPAINDLISLSSESESKEFLSKIFLSLGEIYLSINNSEEAYENFEKGANFSNNRVLREQVYFQIAEISYHNEDFDKALSSYNKVISNTLSPSRIQESNLKIIKILRQKGDLNKSIEKIKQLMIDDSFDSIKSDLELELTKIEQLKGNLKYALDNFDRIGQEYPNTLASVESYYLLSNLYLNNPNLNYEKAQFFMNESMKQNINSPFKKSIIKKRDDIDNLIKLNVELENLNGLKKAENLFISGQILAFNLSKYDESKMYFEEIVTKHKSSDYFTQSLFALYTINLKIGNNEYLNYRDKIISDYPNSDFAKYIINSEGINMKHLPSETLIKAEQLKGKNFNESLTLYKKVISIDKSSDSSKIAAYFLGMYYDYEVSIIDSAKYFYQFVSENFPSSSQAESANKRLEVFNAE
jgi:tetratricopeptide (TPR) repeat protein